MVASDSVRPVVWMAQTLANTLRERLATAKTAVTETSSLKDFLKVVREQRKTVAFVDGPHLASLVKEGASLPCRVIAISDAPLQTSVLWLREYPWLSHVLSTGMLQHPMIGEHIANLIGTLTRPREPALLDWIGATVAGRRVLLTQASRRADRIARMSEFFEANGVGSRTNELLRDVAEELLTNAFYDAPVAAGVVKKAISRVQDVSLPEDDACDLVYACRDDMALVRVRDPFGALTRERLVDVLIRCSRADMQVEVDETMGGAGLGLWRIFSVASFVAISVVANKHTEFLVGIAKRAAAGQKPYAFHLFFREGAKRRFWQLFGDETSDLSIDEIDKSVIISKD